MLIHVMQQSVCQGDSGGGKEIKKNKKQNQTHKSFKFLLRDPAGLYVLMS